MKKQNIIKIALFAATGSLLMACSVEKRHYTKGYHVQWGAGKSTTAQATPAKPAEKVEVATKTATLETVNTKDVVTALPNGAAVAVNKPKATTAKKSSQVVATTQPSPAAVKAATKTVVKPYQAPTLKKNTTAPKKTMIDIIVLLLCVFLGWLGIHRFYLKYTVSGIVMLALFLLAVFPFFLGILGFLSYIAGILLFVWVVYDLIMILTDGAFFFPR